jgi:hypothetical protein
LGFFSPSLEFGNFRYPFQTGRSYNFRLESATMAPTAFALNAVARSVAWRFTTLGPQKENTIHLLYFCFTT